MKKLSLLVLGKLAEMICGDKPYSYLPYRSSSALTGFFGDLDLNYVHDGSTRRDWVRSVLEELNTRPATTTDLPSQEMMKVIEYLLHPDHFNSTKAHDQDQAIASVNEYLRPYEICVIKSNRTHTVTLHPLYEEFVSPASEHTKMGEPKAAFDTDAGYAFIAMPMDPDDHTLVDVLEAIKESAARCSIHAERIDEPPSNERITDRMLDSIRRAEYVIVDLTNARPNVFYEAGYAHGLGKIPIYLAKQGTKLEFDLKDYPVLFFRNLKELKDSLEKRLRGLQENLKT